MDSNVEAFLALTDFGASKLPIPLSCTILQDFGSWVPHNVDAKGNPSYLTQYHEGTGVTHRMDMPLWEVFSLPNSILDFKNEDGQYSFRPIIVVPNGARRGGSSYYTPQPNIDTAVQSQVAWLQTGNQLRSQQNIPGHVGNVFQGQVNNVQHAGAIIYDGGLLRFRMHQNDGTYKLV
ncbi:hypothetical protein XPA_009605 [Xanthoria parietina]